MKQLLSIISASFFLFACQTGKIVQSPEPSAISYIDLQDLRVNDSASQSLDFDGDKKPDLMVSTLLINDDHSGRQDLQYIAISRANSYLLLDNQEDAAMNITPRLTAGTIINARPPDTYHWVNVASVILSKKVMQDNNMVRWDGMWKDADHNYLPFQLKKTGGNYYGWLEISMDTRSETMTLHRAAISKAPGRIIRTGN